MSEVFRIRHPRSLADRFPRRAQRRPPPAVISTTATSQPSASPVVQGTNRGRSSAAIVVILVVTIAAFFVWVWFSQRKYAELRDLVRLAVPASDRRGILASMLSVAREARDESAPDAPLFPTRRTLLGAVLGERVVEWDATATLGTDEEGLKTMTAALKRGASSNGWKAAAFRLPSARLGVVRITDASTGIRIEIVAYRFEAGETRELAWSGGNKTLQTGDLVPFAKDKSSVEGVVFDMPSAPEALLRAWFGDEWNEPDRACANLASGKGGERVCAESHVSRYRKEGWLFGADGVGAMAGTSLGAGLSLAHPATAVAAVAVAPAGLLARSRIDPAPVLTPSLTRTVAPVILGLVAGYALKGTS
jgi:hypothetical protein